MLWPVFLTVVLLLIAGWLVAQSIKQRGGLFTTVYEWDHALLYVDGRFERLLPAGRFIRLSVWPRRDIFTLRRTEQSASTPAIDVTSADKLMFRLSAIVTYRVTDARAAFENEHQEKIHLAAANALVALAAGRTIEAFLADRAGADATLMTLLPSPLCGCEITGMRIRAVTVPPEVRRLFVEIERAKLEGLAALERARGEHAALRSLANAAAMLKGNPELMNLRILQAMSAASGKNQLTLVLGERAFLPGAAETDATRGGKS